MTGFSLSSVNQFLVANAHILMWIFIFAGVGLVLMLGVLFITNRAVKKAAVKKPAPPPPPKEIGPVPITKTPPHFGWISEYLTMRGFFRVGDLGLSFIRAIQFLRQHLGTYTPHYDLPWYLLIGAAGDGKSSLMRRSKLSLPVGEPDFGMKGDPDVKWWFLNHGVVLDIKGNYFLNRGDNKSNEGGWRTVLSLLARYRAKRPIDGIILTISADELIGKNALSPEDLVERARVVAAKLHISQQSLGLTLPVYLVVTKSDYIPGFKSFCYEIPSINSGNILGWSNPYAINSSYTPIWVDQAFSFITQAINNITLEILAGREAADTRDGAFVFSSQLLSIKDSLGIYINQIFRDSAYNEGLLFRGLYFTGDGSGHDVGATLAIADLKELNTENLLGARDIFFASELFTHKIFKEVGLAQPIKMRVAKANRYLRAAKLSTAGLVTLTTFGLFHSYNKLSSQNDDLIPVLGKISVALSQLHKTGGADSLETIALFDSYAKQIIQMMETLSQSQFSSVFMPPSWFSPIEDRLHRSLKISYNQIILRTIYVDLLLKGRKLLYLRPTSLDRSTTFGQVIMPTSSKEFALVRDYVVQIIELGRMINYFNELAKSNDISPLRELVKYTFNSDLPQSFEDEFHNFRRILRDISFSPIDIEPYKFLAQDTLRILYKYFLTSLLSPNDPASIPGRLNTFLYQYGQKDTPSSSVQYLRDFAKSLNDTMPSLGPVGKTWMDGSYFDAGDDFVSFIGVINDSPILGGKTMVSELAAMTATFFSAFKTQMFRLLPLVGDHKTNPLVDLKSQAVPSMVLDSLNKGLGTLFNQPFMAIPPVGELLTSVPETKMIYWDAKLIEDADAMVKAFEAYRVKDLLLLPAVIRESIMLIAQQNLQSNILSSLARSQAVVDAPTSGSVGTTAEETMRAEINNVKEVAPRMVVLLKSLQKGGDSRAFIALRNLLSNFAIGLLEKIEVACMQNNAPYKIKDNNFNWWDGSAGAMYEAYDITNSDDLNRYFINTREHIRTWSMEFAKYIVEFLSSDVFKDATFNRALVDRWARIIEQVKIYDTKKPTNSINSLEKGISVLNTVSLDSCFSTINLAEVKESSGELFIDIKRFLGREMLARCEVLVRQRTIDNYTNLVQQFNDKLKGNFPFVGGNLATSKGEADPGDIREFFDMYEQYGNDPGKILAQVGELGPMAKPALSFLKQMEKVKEFFAEYLAADSDDAVPGFDLTMDFRVNRHHEQRANSIVHMYFKPNEDSSIDQHERDRFGHWEYGSTVEVGFRWPEGIDIAPSLDETQKYMSVSNKTARFTFEGNWALLWLLRVYAQPLPSQTEPSPYLLKFVIPTDNEKSIIFDKLTLRGSARGRSGGKVINVPTFPSVAPDMPKQVLAVKDAVIVRGKVKPSDNGGDSASDGGGDDGDNADGSDGGDN